MADKKISQLTAASTPVAGTEVLPIVQSSTTVKVSIANLTAGRATNGLTWTSTSAGADTAVLAGTGLTVTHAGGSTSFATFNQFPGWGGALSITSSATEFGVNSSLPFAIRNSAGAEIAKFSPTASAVNEVTITSAATGGAPSIAATGDDSNVLLRLNPKGTGYIDVQKSAAAGVIEGLRLTNPQNAGTTGDGVSIRFQNTPDPAQNRHARIESYSADTFGQSAGLRFLINNASDAPRTVLDLPGGSTGNVRVAEGNLVVGTAAKGIDFSANTGAAGETSALLNWYEEGTWTPQISSGATDATMGADNAGRYTRVGRVVHIHAWIECSNLNGIGGGQISIKGLPFTVNNGYSGYGGSTAGFASGLAITAGQSVGFRPGASSTEMTPYVWNSAAGSSIMTGTEWSDDGTVAVSLTYLI